MLRAAVDNGWLPRVVHDGSAARVQARGRRRRSSRISRWMLPKPCSVRSALLFLSWFIGAAALAAYPEKPIRFVIPSAAGGSPDVLMRVMTQQLSTQIGVPFVVENKPGASFTPRHDGRGEGRPRRLHARLRQHRLARHQPLVAGKSALRRGEGPHAGVELRAGLQPARGQQQAAGPVGPGTDRLREEESGGAW